MEYRLEWPSIKEQNYSASESAVREPEGWKVNLGTGDRYVGVVPSAIFLDSGTESF